MLRYENKIHEVQQLKKELDAHKPLSRDILNGLKEYYRTTVRPE